MDLNTLAAAVVAQLTRIADAAEAAGGSAPAAPADKAPASKAPASKAPASKAPAKAKTTKEALEKILLAVKDHELGGKPAAQALFSALGYEKMTTIEEKDYDKIFAAATAKLEELEASGNEPADDDI